MSAKNAAQVRRDTFKNEFDALKSEAEKLIKGPTP